MNTDGHVSRAAIVAAILRKDLAAHTRDRFFVFVTALGIVAYVVVFWLLPNSVDETITVGVHQTGMDEVFEQAVATQGAGIKFVMFETSGALQAALGLNEREAEEQLAIGLDFPADFLQRVAAGEQTTVQVYVDAGVPPAIRRAMSSLVREMAYALTGNALPVAAPAQETVILGEDRAGDQVPLREKMRPLAAFLILMVEVMALGTLVASEVHSRTVKAVLVTPTRTADFLMAKGLFGTALAFVEATLVMLLIGSFARQPLILLTALLLGAVLVTGCGLIAGASGQDFIGMVFYSMIFMIPLLIPAVAALFPGSASIWVQVLPSYGLVQAIVGVSSYDAGWPEVLPYLGMLLAWCVALFGVGWYVLKRKVEAL